MSKKRTETADDDADEVASILRNIEPVEHDLLTVRLRGYRQEGGLLITEAQVVNSYALEVHSAECNILRDQVALIVRMAPGVTLQSRFRGVR